MQAVPGQGNNPRPIEVLDSLKLLFESRTAYLDAIIDYNQAHFELYVALGQPPDAALAHPDVAEAAVIGVPHPKWQERPLLLVVPAPDRAPAPEDLRRWLAGRVPKLWLPDAVLLVDALPRTATGKVQKAVLRERYASLSLPPRMHSHPPNTDRTA